MLNFKKISFIKYSKIIAIMWVYKLKNEDDTSNEHKKMWCTVCTPKPFQRQPTLAFSFPFFLFFFNSR